MKHKPEDTPLSHIIRAMIRADGPLSLSSYMSLCLSHPEHGYYMTRDPFGQKGDFTTAPEISQLFGEITGLWVLDQWQRMGAPSHLQLIELGPGRGTWMKDITRVLSSVSHKPCSLAIDLVEISPVLKKLQAKTLHHLDSPVQWHDSLQDIHIKGPCIILANEFFDALPVRPYVYSENQWQEVVITLDSQGRFQTALSRTDMDFDSLSLHKITRKTPFKNGTRIELSPARLGAMEALCEGLQGPQRAALIIDYGYRQAPLGDTVQALYRHRPCPITDHCGRADLTAHVDFLALEAVARRKKITITSATTQQDFLLSHGLLERAGQLGAGKDKATQQALSEAVDRLAGDRQMGKLFKVLSLASPLSHPSGIVDPHNTP
jgi:SAM-dependent MidA family methyltransferase